MHRFRWLVVLVVFALLPSAPAAAAGRGSFHVRGVSFLDRAHGWALGDRAGRAALLRTDDAGATWTRLPAPPVELLWSDVATGRLPAVDSVRFTDARHGWLFRPGLVSTSDGGRTWTREAPGRVEDVVVAGTTVAALADPAGTGRLHLQTATIGSHRWTTLPTPARGRALLLSAGHSLVLVQTGSPAGVGALWRSADGGRSWSRRSLPCTPLHDWAGTAGISYAQQSVWYVDCYDDQQSSQHLRTSHRLWRSLDAGRRWTRLGMPTRQGFPESLAASGSRLLVSTSSGAGDTMSTSGDGGRHWVDAFTDGGTFYGWQGPEFVTSRSAYAVGPTHFAPEHLYRTDDGGADWTRVAVG